MVVAAIPRTHQKRHIDDIRFSSWLKNLGASKFDTPTDLVNWGPISFGKKSRVLATDRIVSKHERICKERAAAFAYVACNHACFSIDDLLYNSCGSGKRPEELKQHEMSLFCCPEKLHLHKLPS
uniref:Uncharacterized protein n=1 Tax=Caenorhabditis tropicalis TaxID=1561998 RepID=A0A1I7T6X1_9PELO